MPAVAMAQFTHDGKTHYFRETRIKAVEDFITAHPGCVSSTIAWETGIPATTINRMILVIPKLFALAKAGKVGVRDKGVLPQWYSVAGSPNAPRLSGSEIIATTHLPIPTSVTDPVLIANFQMFFNTIMTDMMERGVSPKKVRKRFEYYVSLGGTNFSNTQGLLNSSRKQAATITQLKSIVKEKDFKIQALEAQLLLIEGGASGEQPEFTLQEVA